MAASQSTAASNEWTAYYDRFPYFSHDKIRIYRLKRKTPSKNFILYAIPRKVEVMHASLVLKDGIYGINEKNEKELLEKANSQFADMMDAITRFQQDD